jgi:hypothetical protein
MKWPPKGEGACSNAPIPKLTGLPGAYYFAPIVQGAAATPVRCCVVCGVPVENLNLGGHDAPSAFRGPLWCLRCADGGRPQ